MTNRQDVLDAALDAVIEGGSPAPVDAELVPMLSVAERLRAGLPPAVPPAVEERHLAAISGAGQHVVGPRLARRRRAAVVGLAAAIALTMMASSAVAASQSAVPGDALYGVKRASERVGLALQRSSGSKAKLHLTFADRRLAELQELLSRRDAGEDVDVGAAMAAYTAELTAAEREAGVALSLGQDREALLAHVLANIDKHVARLEFLRDEKVNPKAAAALQRAIDNAQKARDAVSKGKGAPAATGQPGPAPSEGRGRENAPGQIKKSGPPAP